jgi:hypothetical protein
MFGWPESFPGSKGINKTAAVLRGGGRFPFGVVIATQVAPWDILSETVWLSFARGDAMVGNNSWIHVSNPRWVGHSG